MICPKCGEVNSTNFLFCGMCGTILEPARKASVPTPPPAPPAAPPKPAPASAAGVNAPVLRPATTTIPTVPAAVSPAAPPRPIAPPAPALGGPSLSGFEQPNPDLLRDRAFSGLSSYAEAGESGSRAKRVLLFLLLIALLGGAGWWTYTNYLSATDNHKPTAPAPIATMPPGDNSTKRAAKDLPSEPVNLPVRSASAPAGPVVTPEPPAHKGSTESAKQKVAEAATPALPPAKHEVSATRLPAQPADESGDALFKRGQHYLYGRGGTEDCVNAMKYLKMASDKQNAKARSAMGTMYATGHCVSRDLPSAYRWFALALRADPSNSVVEQNLTSVWNQMTPPERQLATRSE